MKILIIISSLRKKNTFEAVKKLEETHKKYSESVDYEYLFLKDLNFKQCNGCFLCISKGEDKCPHKDDRNMIIGKIESADCIVFACPNSVMNVNWLTKNLIDRFAYNLHRPMYFNKRFIMLVTSGNYMGANQAMKALSLLASGGKIIGKLMLYTAPELSQKKLSKQDRVFHQKAEKIFHKLDKEYIHKVPFVNLFWFASFKALHNVNKNTLSADYEFYKDKEYFIDIKLSSVQKSIINGFTVLFRKILV